MLQQNSLEPRGTCALEERALSGNTDLYIVWVDLGLRRCNRLRRKVTRQIAGSALPGSGEGRRCGMRIRIQRVEGGRIARVTARQHENRHIRIEKPELVDIRELVRRAPATRRNVRGNDRPVQLPGQTFL